MWIQKTSFKNSRERGLDELYCEETVADNENKWVRRRRSEKDVMLYGL